MSPSTSKPEFILVPGAWHPPTAFQPTTTLLEKAGYTVHGVSLPSVGTSPSLADFQPDALAIRSKINEVLSSGKDVVVAVHSYGGVAGSEALAEYVHNLESGKKNEGWGSVKRIVYIAAFALPEGMSLWAALGGQAPPWLEVNEADGFAICKDPQEIFYNDISPSVAAEHISSLRPHSFKTFHSTLTVAPWKVIPSTYVLCEADNAIPVQGQEGMIAGAQAVQSTAFDVVERTSAGHSPFISQPEWLAERLVKAAA